MFLKLNNSFDRFCEYVKDITVKYLNDVLIIGN